jgi:predicted ATP-dependent serine protease
VSAAEALRNFEGNESNFISTGLMALDASLQSELGTAHQGGIQRGHVTEIWGPPGVGKTAFGYACSDPAARTLLTRPESSLLQIASLKAGALSG